MIDKFRDELDKQLNAAMSAATNRAINVRVRPMTTAQDGKSTILVPATTAEELALTVTDALAEARAYGRAQQIVAETFKKIVAPEPEVEADKPAKGRMYG